MKIEMGESLMLSWAKHIKHCQIATSNWKYSKVWDKHNTEEICDLINKINSQFSSDVFGKTTPEQLIAQAETDVLGIEIDNNSVKNIYAIEVAFHENGLHYNKNSKENNLNNITKKFLRSALVLYSVFNTKQGNIIFASPKVNPKDEKVLLERTNQIEEFMKSLGFDFKFSFICNQNFYEQIFLPIKQNYKQISDTGELFVRSLQMVMLFDENSKSIRSPITIQYTAKKPITTTTNTKPSQKLDMLLKAIGKGTFEACYDVIAKNYNSDREAIKRAIDKYGFETTGKHYEINSVNTKTNNSCTIFKLGMEKEALEICKNRKNI